MTVVHEPQAGGTGVQKIIESTLLLRKAESVPSYRSDDTGRSKSLSTIHNWDFIVIKLFNSGTERFAKNVVELLHSDKSNIQTIQNELKNVTFCSRLWRETCSQMLENRRLVSRK